MRKYTCTCCGYKTLDNVLVLAGYVDEEEFDFLTDVTLLGKILSLIF